MGRHSKNPSQSSSTSGSPAVSGAQFDAQYNTARINAGPPQDADQRIAALKHVVSDSRNHTRKD